MAAPSPDGRLSLPDLSSARSSERLKVISRLRRRGIGEHIALPQIIVCGDQNVGKSSVLEGITGFPFPRSEGLCTRFATEIILEDGTGPVTIKVTIIPHSKQSLEKKMSLLSFHKDITNLAKLPEVVQEAGALMGVKGYVNNINGPAFGADVLQIKISGPTGLHLSVVDLPGIIQVAGEGRSNEDVQKVHEIVDTYMQNPRSIILAVVQANNDIENQLVIKKCQDFDPEGQRTIGIITRPDMINAGSEERIAKLSRNEDTTKLKLGFFLLKNPSPTEAKVISNQTTREALEQKFFSTGAWKHQDLRQDRVGISNLRSYLQVLLDQHIEEAMPQVREEIRALQQATDRQLRQLGAERQSPKDIRIYLLGIATRFRSICSFALQGSYHLDSFFDDGDRNGIEGRPPAKRLRAAVHTENTEFSDVMRQKGAKFDIKKNGNSQEVKEWISTVYRETRGQELSGDYNSVFVSELFRQQSSRWKEQATTHLNDVCKTVDTFLQQLTAYLVNDTHTRAAIQRIIRDAVSEMKASAFQELELICEDEARQPMTYNHYYTDNVQKSRDASTRKLIQSAVTKSKENAQLSPFAGVSAFGNTSNLSAPATPLPSTPANTTDNLLSTLQKHIIVDMDERACNEARMAVDAYYKVARKTFVDNVCRQVIERRLLSRLSDVFSIETVGGLSDEELRAIAGETQSTTEERRRLQNLKKDLQDSLMDLSM